MAASNQTVVVRLPGVLVDLFPGAPRRLEMTAATVAEVIDELDRQFPGMGDRLRDTRPAIRKHINVFVDGDKLKLSAPLRPGCEVFILTAISGG
ncbi:MoaD/ThiS family protein [Oryzicola mucosus]|uniref:MoaD/ThiS family protein n=1 Tax=Oryzicola mucosus TaxID=2767425 RepID=A0A8J6PV51_9HYPH|nr:MoaD/ThiS family protein [Oryzicola mucosus]MBD0414662.1 MoaD/ThiS family protein [Oryzicola mucosus]